MQEQREKKKEEGEKKEDGEGGAENGEAQGEDGAERENTEVVIYLICYNYATISMYHCSLATCRLNSTSFHEFINLLLLMSMCL